MTTEQLFAACTEMAPSFTMTRVDDPKHGWCWVGSYRRDGKLHELSDVDDPKFDVRGFVLQGCYETLRKATVH